jgi:protein-S-isoprenylcysteine O-methyltransferase Ste14
MDALQSPTSVPDTAGVIAPPPVIFAAWFGAAILLQWVHPLRIPVYPIGLEWPGLVLMNLSWMLALWGTFSMRRGGTNINPYLPTISLVISGPYRFSRNPLSLSLLLLYVGLSLRIDTFWPLLLLIPLLIVFHFGVVVREEKYLETKFGEAYRAYCASVRRWI